MILWSMREQTRKWSHANRKAKKDDSLIYLGATDNESESDFSDCSVTFSLGLRVGLLVAIIVWMISSNF